MKKMLMLAFVALSMFVSCGKDKEEKSKEGGIVGTWYFESPSANGETIFDDCQKKSYFIFTDKTYDEVVYADTRRNGECKEEERHKGTYTISGDQITLKEENGYSQTRLFSVNGKTLTLIQKYIRNGEEITLVLILKKR